MVIWGKMSVPYPSIPLLFQLTFVQEANRIASLVESTLGAYPLPNDKKVFELSRILPEGRYRIELPKYLLHISLK